MLTDSRLDGTSILTVFLWGLESWKSELRRSASGSAGSVAVSSISIDIEEFVCGILGTFWSLWG